MTFRASVLPHSSLLRSRLSGCHATLARKEVPSAGALRDIPKHACEFINLTILRARHQGTRETRRNVLPEFIFQFGSLSPRGIKERFSLNQKGHRNKGNNDRRPVCEKFVASPCFLTIRKFVSTLDARVGNYWIGEVCVTIFSPILNFSALQKLPVLEVPVRRS